MVFRSHPQLVRGFFNSHRCGPPPRVTGGSAWPWIDHPASGPPPATQARSSHSLSLRLGQRLRLAAEGDSQTHYAKGRRSPLAGLPQLEGARLQVLFHSPRGVLFTFPSRYWFAIGRRLVFSLGGWAPRIRAGFHVSRPTWDPRGGRGRFAHGAFTLSGGPFQALALEPPAPWPGPATPRGVPRGLGVVRVRSPLLAESLLFSLPPATEMFHFAGSGARRTIWFMRGRHPAGCRVAPFGDPRIEGRVRLPGDYRGLPRPSSPAAAKASSARPYSLDAWKSQAPGPTARGRGERNQARGRQNAPLLADRGRAQARPRRLARPAPRRSRAAAGAAASLSNLHSRFYGCLPKSGPARKRRRPRESPPPAPRARGCRRGAGLVGAHGFGPWTSSLSETRSNQLSYAPPPPPSGNGTVQCGAWPGRPSRAACSFLEGGDPAAGSPTATLLRLHPSHRSQLGRSRGFGRLRLP